MARRIAGVGRVTVSLRRSTAGSGMARLRLGSRGLLGNIGQSAKARASAVLQEQHISAHAQASNEREPAAVQAVRIVFSSCGEFAHAAFRVWFRSHHAADAARHGVRDAGRSGRCRARSRSTPACAAANGLTGRDMARQIMARNGITDVDRGSGRRRALGPLRPGDAKSPVVGRPTSPATRSRPSPWRHTRWGTCCNTTRATSRWRCARPWRRRWASPARRRGRCSSSACLIGPRMPFSGLLMDLGIAFFAGAVLFHVVTLPVEFDASKRALAQLTETGSRAAAGGRGREEGAGRGRTHLRGGGGHGGAAAAASDRAAQRPALMARAKRPGPAAAREASPRAADGRLPAAARALCVAALALLALRVLAVFVPGRWLWGLDLGRDLAPADVRGAAAAGARAVRAERGARRRPRWYRASRVRSRCWRWRWR